MSESAITRRSVLEKVRKNEPVLLSFRDLKALPRRRDFLIDDPKLDIDELLDSGEPVPFLACKHEIKYSSYGKNVYYIFGTIPNGDNMCVIVKNIDIYFHVRVRDDKTPDEMYTYLKTKAAMLNGHISMPVNAMTEYMRPAADGFVNYKVPYLKISFNNVKDRDASLAKIYKHNDDTGDIIITTEDDKGNGDNYFDVFARESNFATANWNIVSGYSAPEKHEVCDDIKYVLEVNNIGHINKYNDEEDYKYMTKDNRYLINSWDIEVYNTSDKILTRDTDVYTVYSIGSTYGWHSSSKPFVTFCCHEGLQRAIPNVNITITCKNEQEVVEAHLTIVALMKPNLTLGFNTGRYDWQMVLQKASDYDLYEQFYRAYSFMDVPYGGFDKEKFYNWNWRKGVNIKIDAGTSECLDYLNNMPGLIDIDLLPLMRKVYTKESNYSLNHMLKLAKLDGKEDMPYIRMFNIYKRFLQLKKAKNECHCGAPCRLCNEHIDVLDYKPLPAENELVTLYSTELHDHLKDKCCYCGKRQQNLKDNEDVAYYCVVDCVRPHELIYRQSIIPGAAELATLSMTSLYSGLYLANGRKVRNIVASLFYQRKIAFSNAQKRNLDMTKKQFNVGAYVKKPILGYNNTAPIATLDFAQLYPNIIKSWNLSLETLVFTEEHANRLREEGYTVNEIGPFDIQIGEKKDAKDNEVQEIRAWVVMHSNVCEGDTEIIDHFDKEITLTLTNEDGTESTIKCMGKLSDEAQEALKNCKTYNRSYKFIPVKGRAALQNEQLGVYPTALDRLTKKRADVRAKIEVYKKIIEEMKNSGEKTRIVDGIEHTINSLEYEAVKTDIKQNAIKILSNTFYGASGEFKSTLYHAAISGGTTYFGRLLIKNVEKMLMNAGSVVNYGDTDSQMFQAPQRELDKLNVLTQNNIKELEKKYSGHELTTALENEFVEHVNRMLNTTRKFAIEHMQEKVHDMTLRVSGSIFLKMEFEKVSFLTLLSGKKKYAMGIYEPDKDNVGKNKFKYNMIKGYEAVKSTKAAIIKYNGDKLMKQLMYVHNKKTPLEIIKELVVEFINSNIPIKDYACTAVYRPNKQNKSINKFVANIKAKHEQAIRDKDTLLRDAYLPPDPNERIIYIIAKKEQQYTFGGKKVDLKKGDRFEMLKTYIMLENTDKKLEIDKDMYLRDNVLKCLARYLFGAPEVEEGTDKYDISNDDEYKKADKLRMKNALKLLNKYCDEILVKKETQNFGRVYKSYYLELTKIILHNLRPTIMPELYDVIKTFYTTGEYIEADLEKIIVDHIEYTARDIGAETKKYISKNGARQADDHELFREYYEDIYEKFGANIKKINKCVRKIIDIHKKKLSEILDKIADKIRSNNSDVVTIKKSQISYINTFDTYEYKYINKFAYLYHDASALYYRHKQYNDYLVICEEIRVANF